MADIFFISDSSTYILSSTGAYSTVCSTVDVISALLSTYGVGPDRLCAAVRDVVAEVLLCVSVTRRGI